MSNISILFDNISYNGVSEGISFSDFTSSALYLPLCTLLVFFVLWTILWHAQRSLRAEHQHLEGPFRWPVVGSYVEVRRNFWRTHDWLLGYFSQHSKTILVDYGFSVNVLTVDPKNVEHMLATNFSNYPKGQKLHDRLEDWLGNGIFNVDGEMWKKQRKIASYEFSARKLRDFSCIVFRDDAVKLAKLLDTAATSQHVVDFQELCMRMTLDSICKVGFGVDLNSCSSSLPAVPFGIAFDSANENSLIRQISFFWKLWRFCNIGSEKQMRKNLGILDSFVYSIIHKRRAEVETTLKSGKECVKEDLLSRFMRCNGEDGEIHTDKDLRDTIMNFLIAGRDTIAVTLSWFIYCICKHPCVSEKVHSELNDVLGDTQGLSYEEFASLLSFTSLNKMHYLHAAISETIRLYPAVPKDTKIALNDDVLPDGTLIQRGYLLAFVPYSMGRMEFLWGADACEFRPERWLKNGNFQPESPFKFTAFQAGPRICLGKDSAYLQMKMTAALLIRFFNFKLLPGQIIHYRLMSVLSILNGLKVQVSHCQPKCTL